MALNHTNFLMHRVVMPLIFTVSALLRPSGISLVYLMLFFVLPFISVPVNTITGSTKALYIVSIAISIILLLLNVGFQISLVASTAIQNAIEPCFFMEKLLRHIGFIRMNDFKNAGMIILWIIPELIVFVGATLVFVLLKKNTNIPSEEPLVPQSVEEGAEDTKKISKKRRLRQSQFRALTCLVVLFFTSAIRPSVIGGFYFLIFLLSGTYWACYKTLGRGFGLIMRLVLGVLIVHIITFVIYQTPFAQDYLGSDKLIIRLAGLEPLFNASCDNKHDIRVISLDTDNYRWDSFIFPFVMLFTYYIISIHSITLLKENQIMLKGAHNPEQTEMSERTPLMIRTRRKSHRQVSAGETSQASVMAMEGQNPELEEIKEDDEAPNFWRNIHYGLRSVVDMACEHSYLFTSITMMTWSIIYHSWLTFVFLIWANILWMIPNQRQAMLRSSPFIVVYAEFLLIATYIYGMKLNDDELPTHVETPGISLEQIGFLRPSDPVCVPLFVKVIFTCIFWITMRQLFKETQQKKKVQPPSASSEAPVTHRRSTTTSQDMGSDAGIQPSKFLKQMGQYAKNILVKSWIWLLIAVIFICAISGKKMTGFRIFYMALFLFFLLAFQISWIGWMKVMFGYWVFLIIYAMFTLILIYTYQFQNFPNYWENYLGIPDKLQHDIGLEIFEVKGLFLHLFAPTIIVIMTAIQVHYIHKEFIASLRRSIASRSQQRRVYEESKTKDTSLIIESTTEDDDETKTDSGLQKTVKWQTKIKNYWNNLFDFFHDAIEFMWTLFEVHLVKIIFIVAFICCIKTVSFLHLVFVFLCVIAVTSRERFQVFFTRLIAVIMAILILSNMIYQIEYIHHTDYSVLCNTTSPNQTISNMFSNNNNNQYANQTLDQTTITPITTTSTTTQIIITNRTMANSSSTNITDNSASSNNDTDDDFNNNAKWFGFIKTGKSGSLLNILDAYVVFMVFVTLHEISLYRKAYSNSNNEIEYKRPNVIFPGVTRQHAEENLKGLLKYLFNYCYYKFGLEITLVALVSCICIHQDLPALLYSIWLCIFIVLDRRTCAKLWRAFLIFTSIMVPLQYLIIVDLPPGLCIEYPWTKIPGLSQWAMLPGPRGIHKYSKLLFDFILLMFISRQQRVFLLEEKNRKENIDYVGGSNSWIIDDLSKYKKDDIFINPTVNFMERVRNWSDIIKVIVFNGFFWITLTTIFLAATQTINLFSVGYLVGAFIFLWQGTDFYLRPLKQVIQWWKYLIYYNVAVITIQTALQIGGCLFFEVLQDKSCWFVHLLGVGCATSNVNIAHSDMKHCPATYDEDGIEWDVVCFTFLLIQLRIFSSYYFCHIVNETRASSLLAERGSELIEDLRQKEIKHKEKQEQKILRKIKKKMEKIRATQQRALGSEKPTHYDDEATVPLIRSSSLMSCPGSGYHTPIEDEDPNNEEEFLSDLQSDLGMNNLSAQNQALSPSSAFMTISLEGYLEPKRFSFSSPSTRRRTQSDSQSVSVFSSPNTPKEIETKPAITKFQTIPKSSGTKNILVSNLTPPDTSHSLNVSKGHRRQSSGTSVSWNERVKKIESDKKSLHKRHSSTGTTANISSSITQDHSSRQHSSGRSGVLDDSVSTPGLATTNNMYFIDSLATEASSITSHGESIRAGDYYMFDDVDEKFELDLLEEEEDYLGTTERLSTSEKKLKDRKTLLEVCKSIDHTKTKEKLKKQASSASAPPPETQLQQEQQLRELDEPSKTVHSDPLPIISTSFSDKPDQPSDSTDPPSTSKGRKSGGEEPKKELDEEKTTTDTSVTPEEQRNAIVRILEAILVALAVRLSRYSRQYRYVMRVLSKEKKALKDNEEFSKANLHLEGGQAWTPLKFLQKIKQESSQTKQSDGGQSTSSSHNTPTTSRAAARLSLTQSSDIIKSTEPESETIDTTKDTDIKTFDTEHQKDLQRAELESVETTSRKMRRTSTVPEIRILAPSLERGLAESTITLDIHRTKDKSDERDDDFDDYDEDDFVSQDHHVAVEFLIALWYAVLANTDFVCYFIVFLNQVVSASILSLPLPFMVFMWGTLSLPRPTKTFWVTLIAYTLSVVLIKCVFQFKMIWNDYLSLPNQPLSAATIIGIESKTNYATLDLILLLVLFFHRFILKSQGLWKSSYRLDNIHDGIYILKDSVPAEIKNNHPVQKTDEDVNQTVVITKHEKTLVLEKSTPPIEGGDYAEPEQVHVHVSSITDEPSNYLPGVVKITSAKYCSSIVDFFKDLIHLRRLPCDVYAFMFLCDFTNFFVLLLGFTAFGSQHGDGGVSTYLAENKVPIPFLIMLLIQFFLIIADRAIYLRKSLVHKIIYHYFTIIGIHIWMFFVVPGVTERKFNALAPPIVFYMIKCFYFLLSSYQIRCGYPKRILGNFLCKGFTVMNMIFFKIYMLTPFLYELRTFLDWVCTESTFTVFDWLKMEDIFAEIFCLKCSRQMEKDFPVPRATKKPMLTKILMGGAAVVAIVVLVWAPLTLFALNNAVGYANVPFRATALLQIGPYEPIYEIRTADSIKPFNLEDMEKLQNAYRRDKTALTFITSYDADDIAAILLQTNSPELWRISPPSKQLLIEDVEEGKDIFFHFSYTISRSPPNKQVSETLSAETKYVMTDIKEKEALKAMLIGEQTDQNITLTNLLPKFIKIKNSGEMSVITPLTPEGQEYRNISIKLSRDKDNIDNIWWEIREVCDDNYHTKILKNIPFNKACDKNVTLITFSDKKFPETFSFLTAGGIIGMYTTFILVAARVLRSSLITGASRNIMFEDLPYVDRVLQLCLDIYLVREAQEFALEEDLFAKLIFLYRSPETMIKWTRPKEKEDETDETASVQSRNSRRK